MAESSHHGNGRRDRWRHEGCPEKRGAIAVPMRRISNDSADWPWRREDKPTEVVGGRAYTIDQFRNPDSSGIR